MTQAELITKLNLNFSRLAHWRQPNIRKSLCLFCSLGCGVALRLDGDEAKETDYDKDNPINHGSLCPRGYYNLELLNNPQRLLTPRIGERTASWEEALALVSSKLKQAKPETIGIFISALASNEEAFMAGKLAKALGVKNVAAVADPADLEAYQGQRWEVPNASFGRVEGIDNTECLLIIGDILTRSPVLSQRLNKVKYGKRGNKIIVIDPNKTHTTWFATDHLQNKPGTEAQLLAAFIKIISEQTKPEILKADLGKVAASCGITSDHLINAANDFHKAASGYVIVVPSLNKQRNDLINYFAKVLSANSPNKKYLTFYQYGNNLGVNIILDQLLPDRTDYLTMLRLIEKGEIKNILMLGENALTSGPVVKNLNHLDFIASASYFPADLADGKSVQLPLATYLEEKGSYMLADGRSEERLAIVPKVGTKSNFDIIVKIINGEPEAEWDKAATELRELRANWLPREKANLQAKLAEAGEILSQAEFPVEEVTHFGNNELVKRFLWYRINNQGEAAR